MQRSTPLKRTEWKRKPPKAKKTKARSTKNDFPEHVKAAVRRRSGNRCEVNSRKCTGRAAAFHHRKLRRHGDNRDVNCLHACNDCHVEIHHHVTTSYLMGWLVRSEHDPATIPVKVGEGNHAQVG